ncbi:pectinesterase 3 [Salvia miltiorrhiza]|uniref:pectinesterase 3 n=1 Tax=Salvia miltiorrhiza TaxID=226208 RepID=UPI0025AC654A|nr:pectinesterase 3 [Salvia miltiorrhiza]
MALHNNLKLFYLLFFSSLVLPHHLAQPEVSPSPAPDSSGSSPGPAPSPFDYADDEIETQEFSISLPPSSSETPSIAPSADGSIEFDFSPALAPSGDADPALENICDSTDYPSLCLSTVAPYLDGETDIQSVLDVAIQAGAQFSKYGQATAQKLAGNPGNPPQHASVLNDCKDGFENAADNYAKAGDALAEQDKGTVNSMLSAVITYIGDCQETISKDSPLYSLTDRLINMTSNCLAISSLIN